MPTPDERIIETLARMEERAEQHTQLLATMLRQMQDDSAHSAQALAKQITDNNLTLARFLEELLVSASAEVARALLRQEKSTEPSLFENLPADRLQSLLASQQRLAQDLAELHKKRKEQDPQ